MNKNVQLAERGFDPRTSGLWAQHASTAPLCSVGGDVYKSYMKWVDPPNQSTINQLLLTVFLQNLQQKCVLPGGESNPGLPRDRRGYLPLYYRGHVLGRQNIIPNLRYFVFGFAKNHNFKVNSTATAQNVPTADTGSKSEDATTNSP